MSDILERISGLSMKEKRELLAQTLRESPARGSQSPRSPLPVMAVSERPRATAADPVELAAGHPYVRYVNPYLSSWLARLNLDKQFVRGEGCYLYDAQGTGYLDFIAQYGAVPFGYNPPEIWNSIEEARKAQLPSFVQPSILASAGELAERLVRLAPRGLRYVTFASSGAEAIEAAIKLCRSATGRRGILSARQSFHGKTLAAVSATGNAAYQKAFGAPAEGFHHVPFGDVEALNRALTSQKDFYAAFLIEPIQGEGGIVEPPPGYLAQAQSLCRNSETLLVFDEVQTGLGRTGRLFACDHEPITPDVMTLAKALGGGLMPIGACLCTERVYNEEFAIRHSSTFAGNALACRAALATLDLLEKDDQAIVRHVAENGHTLKQELLKLQGRYPDLIRSVRGRGYLLGLELDVDSSALRDGLAGYLADQKLLTYLVVSYLLNVHKIRLAPTASAESVLRIEPPLIAQWTHCRICLDALDLTFNILASGDTAQLIGHLIGVNGPGASTGAELRPLPLRQRARTTFARLKASKTEGRFAFLANLTHPGEIAYLDPALKVLNEAQLVELRRRSAGLLAPSRFSEICLESKTGQKAYGELIIVPYTARELVEMPHDQALREIRHGVEIARRCGAQVVGLGGFTSVVTLGGLALKELGLGPLTTGNSYTVAAARAGVQMACRRKERHLSSSCAAVIGAAGAVGRATSILISPDVARLILIGNPAHSERSNARLREVAGEIVEYLWRLHVGGRHVFSPNTLGATIVATSDRLPLHPATLDFVSLAAEIEKISKCLSVTTDVTSQLSSADVVITATSAVDVILEVDDLKRDAIVLEISRPFNATPELKASRPDVLFVEGGLVRAPSQLNPGWDVGHGPRIVFACMAETMLLALEHRYEDTSLGGNLDLLHIQELDALADKHGFSVECVSA
jgi:acetylornithine/succinyldiaminopimelate/putrescine aminotransferase/predicted amino acid dehydrogenase